MNKTIIVIDSLLSQLVVLLFESPLFCRVREKQREKFTRLTEILLGGVTFSIANGAAFAAFTTCLTFVWFPVLNRAKRSVSIISIVRFPSIVRFVSNVLAVVPGMRFVYVNS